MASTCSSTAHEIESGTENEKAEKHINICNKSSSSEDEMNSESSGNEIENDILSNMGSGGNDGIEIGMYVFTVFVVAGAKLFLFR